MSDNKRTTDESLDKVSGGVSSNANISDLNNPNKSDDFKNPMLISPFGADEKEGGRRKIDAFKNPMLIRPFDADEKEGGRRKIDAFKNQMLINPNNANKKG